jgi:thymidylate synthase
MVQEILAGWLGVEVGTYTHVIDSLHWYEEGSKRMGIDPEVAPARNTDRFSESIDESLGAFNELGDRMDTIIQAHSEGKTPDHISLGGDLPKAFENIFRVVAADDARKGGAHKEADLLMSHCDNPAFQQLWERWLQRLGDEAKALIDRGR